MFKKVLTSLIVFSCLQLVALAASQVNVVEKASLIGSLNSQTAKVGQKVSARLKSELKYNGKVIAPANSIIEGKITKVEQPKRFIHSEVSAKSFMRPGARIYLEFDKIVNKNKTITINAKPNPKTVILDSKTYAIKVDKDSSIVSSTPSDVKSKVGRTSIQVASWFGAPFTPIIGGVVGALKPDVMLPTATDAKSKRHRRLKGMAAGAIAGVPGGFLVNDSVLKGRQTVLKSGSNLDILITDIKN